MKLLVDAHVFDGKYQGTRTYIEGIYTNMLRHEDIDFFFAAHNIDNLRGIFGEAKTYIMSGFILPTILSGWLWSIR
mgnify:CR=1 FL=1